MVQGSSHVQPETRGVLVGAGLVKVYISKYFSFSCSVIYQVQIAGACFFLPYFCVFCALSSQRSY